MSKNPNTILRRITEFIKTEKEGPSKGLHSCFERALIGTGKQTHTMLYMINTYVYHWVKIYILIGSSVTQSQVQELYHDVAIAI